MFSHVLGYTIASTTEPYQANFLDEGLLPSRHNTTYTRKDCSVVELLIYWMQMARGRIQDPNWGCCVARDPPDEWLANIFPQTFCPSRSPEYSSHTSPRHTDMLRASSI